MSNFLYRHFNAGGELLYVGISLSWPTRTKSHARGSAWFEDVTEVKIEKFATRQDALEAERKAIKAEKPKFNIVHNKPGKKPASDRKARKGISVGDYVAFKVATIFGNKPKGFVVSVYDDLVEIEGPGGAQALALAYQVKKIHPPADIVAPRQQKTVDGQKRARYQGATAREN